MGNTIYFVIAEDRSSDRAFSQAKSLEAQRQVWSGLPWKTYYKVVDNTVFPSVEIAARRAEMLLGVNGSDPYSQLANPSGPWCLALKIAATRPGYQRFCFFGLRDDNGPPSPGLPGSLPTFPSPSFDKLPPQLPVGGKPVLDGTRHQPLPGTPGTG